MAIHDHPLMPKMGAPRLARVGCLAAEAAAATALPAGAAVCTTLRGPPGGGAPPGRMVASARGRAPHAARAPPALPGTRGDVRDLPRPLSA